MYKVTPIGTESKEAIYCDSIPRLSAAIAKTYPDSYNTIKVVDKGDGLILITYLEVPVMEIVPVK